MAQDAVARSDGGPSAKLSLVSQNGIVDKLRIARRQVDLALSALDTRRLRLPILDPAAMLERFDELTVTLTELPIGPWSSPIADVVMLAKLTLAYSPKRVLEVGSFRGHTTKIIARHCGPDTHIVAFDRDARHGLAYRDTPLAARIERRIAEVTPAAFAGDARGSFDLIFLDADHTYAAVKADTEILLPLLAPNGIFVWHDYANWGRFTRKNGVPEALHELSARIPVASVAGSWLAVHSPAWCSGEGRARFEAACRSPGEIASLDPWAVLHQRG